MQGKIIIITNCRRKMRYHKRESAFRRAVFSGNAMPPPLQEYFKHENIIPIDLEKFPPNIWCLQNLCREGTVTVYKYFWRRAALFFSFCRQMMGPSEMVFSDDAVGGCLTVYIFFGCLWCHMCYKLGRCFLSGSPFKISFAIHQRRRCHS